MTSLIWKPIAARAKTANIRAGGRSTKLTTALTVAPTTTLAVGALPFAVASGDPIAIVSQAKWSLAFASASATLGATSLTVTSFTPSFAFPVGSFVRDLKWPGSERMYTLAAGQPHQVPEEDAGMVAAGLAAYQGATATVINGPKDH